MARVVPRLGTFFEVRAAVTDDDLTRFDLGPAGTSVWGLVRDQNGSRTVIVVRGPRPDAGVMLVLMADGKTVGKVPFTAANLEAVAEASMLRSPGAVVPMAAATTTSAREPSARARRW